MHMQAVHVQYFCIDVILVWSDWQVNFYLWDLVTFIVGFGYEYASVSVWAIH